jgi:hypothetical protein
MDRYANLKVPKESRPVNLRGRIGFSLIALEAGGVAMKDGTKEGTEGIYNVAPIIPLRNQSPDLRLPDGSGQGSFIYRRGNWRAVIKAIGGVFNPLFSFKK